MEIYNLFFNALNKGKEKESTLYEYRNEEGLVIYDSMERAGGMFVDNSDYQLTGVIIKETTR